MGAIESYGFILPVIINMPGFTKSSYTAGETVSSGNLASFKIRFLSIFLPHLWTLRVTVENKIIKAVH